LSTFSGNEYSRLIKTLLDTNYPVYSPKAFVHTFGCQGNLADSERMKGMLSEIGYEFTDDVNEANLILFNTCSVREHAEDRVFGNVGNLKKLKAEKPDLIIVLCGCMMQQKHVAEKIKKSYPYVDIVFGTYHMQRLPEFIYKVLATRERVFEITDNPEAEIVEGLPVYRDISYKGWLPIMYGCNNFCSYCVVPLVRGRERSRDPEDVINEAKELIKSGAKDITLLGQNVNSYGKNSPFNMDFPELLRRINALEGEFIIRFMTSHPKDCTPELLKVMAESEKVAKHLHLPFQSGSNRILKAMNRKYTREHYLELTTLARELMPELAITSDVIVGFPGEQYEDFTQTLDLVERVKFSSLFTFIYSKRKGTAAEKLPDPVSREEKGRWFNELLKVQERISAEIRQSMVGKTYKVLAENKTKDLDGCITGRTEGNMNIDFLGDESLIGNFVKVKVNKVENLNIKGEMIP
jgi:tRNA-2-methylthio-N6-dimethylallyladenosine synthase